MTTNTLGALQTPALLLDRVKFQNNLARMQRQLSRWPQVKLRPHLKTAKSLAVAEHVAPNRGPITVSTVREAEEFASHGYGDIVYAVGIGPDKLQRIAALNTGGRQVRIILDSVAAARRVADFAASEEVAIPTLIEVDTDGHRGGVKPNDPVVVAIGDILARAGLLCGVLTHAGGSYAARTHEQIAEYSERERSGSLEAAAALRKAGLPVEIISIGSTPTVLYSNDFSGVTEVRAGVYMFNDLVMAGVSVCTPEDIALSVLATVIGHQTERGQLIVDAGWMALSRDRGTQHQAVDFGFGLVCDMDGRSLGDLSVLQTNQEHGVVGSRSGQALDLSRYPIGTHVRILPNHACATASQYALYHVVEGGKVVAEWPRFWQW